MMGPLLGLVKKSPASLRRVLGPVREPFIGMLSRGEERYCPVCQRGSRAFHPFKPLEETSDEVCPPCGSLDRHRLVWLFLTRKMDFSELPPSSFLHVAPEYCLEKRFRKVVGDGYLTADLANPNAMVRMDITDIQYPDASFDAVYCSHVLEHIPDDRKAMAEFFRVLKPGGWAILLVPITAEVTFEDPSVTDPAERLRLFGQANHVRRYGPDYVDRLQEAGFEVGVTCPEDLLSAEEVVRMGLQHCAGEIYFCRKAVEEEEA